MVAGGVPGEEILRDIEAVGGMDGPGSLVARQGQKLHHLLVEAAVGIGKHLQGPARELLQPTAVLDDLVHSKGGAHGFQRGMVQAVARDFMAPVDLGHFFLRNFGAVQRSLHAGPGAACSAAQGTVIQVEGAFQAVLPEQLGKTPVLNHAVVIAQGKGSGLSSGKYQGIKSVVHGPHSFVG